MSGFGNVPTSDDIPGYPLDSIWNEANGSLIPIRGIRPHTDSNGKTTIVVEIAADSGGFAAGSIVDLATLLTLAGTSGDANTVASIMGRLTKIRDLLAATLTISGTTTANIGTSGSLALEAGNLASILAGTGAIGDSAWSLSGNASEIALQKKIALLLQSIAYDSTDKLKASLYGKNSGAGDTPVLLDSSGRVLTKIVDSAGTNQLAIDSSGRVTVVQGAGAAQGTNWRVIGDYQQQTSLSAGSLNADFVPSTDVSAFAHLSIQVEGTYSGTLSFQWSNDNTNFHPLLLSRIDTESWAVTGTSTSTSGIGYQTGISFRYLRIRMTSYSSGTATGTLFLRSVSSAVPRDEMSVLQGTSPWSTKVVPATSGGTTNFHRISTADTNVANIKASAGQVYGYDISNNTASWRYVKLHNNSGTPTAGSGVVRTIGVPPNGKAVYHDPEGIAAFATGIAMTAVAGAADNDTAAVGASELTIDIDYK